MTRRELFYLTGRLVCSGELPAPEALADALSRDEGAGWEELVWQCDSLLLLPLLYLQCKERGWLNRMDPELAAHLAVLYDLNRHRNEAIAEQAAEITRSLVREDIHPTFLKGVANLLDGLYADSGERIIGDIDLLVEEKDFLHAAHILEQEGYISDAAVYEEPANWLHYPSLFREGSPVRVEIHRLPVADFCSRSFTAERVLQARKPLPGLPGAFVPTDAHKVVLTFLHSQLQNRGHSLKQASFRGFRDLYLLSRRTRVRDVMELSGYPRQAAAWLVLAGRTLGIPGRFLSPEPFSARLHCFVYDLSLTFPRLYGIWRFLKKTAHLVLVRYGWKTVKALFHSPDRRALLKRLSDRRWYGRHLRSFRKYFF